MDARGIRKPIMWTLAVLLSMATVLAAGQTPAPNCGNGPFNLEQALSDQAQRTTIAFAGLALITGNLEAQTFFPPGKLVDYWGFQYLRDNDPDNMGHNTSFLTRVSCNVIYILSDAQLAQLKTLASSQVAQINQYGYQRYPLMKAFRRLVEGDLPAGTTGLDLAAVKAASRDLYVLDGQISFDRAVLYANLYRSLSPAQKTYLDAMVGKGWASWPDKSMDDVRTRLQGLSPDESVAVMTYAGDMFSWYAGCVAADIYFCPERHGTYYGGFYIKDAPAIGHEGYSIDETLTATAGSALCDSSKGYVTPAQAALVSSLTDLQRDNLYAGGSNIVQARTDISAALRGLIGPTAPSADLLAQIKATVLAKSAEYGELDGENNYYYATVFAQLESTLSAGQLEQLGELRHSILSGTYADGTPFDFTTCSTYYLFSAPISNPSVLDPYISDTDYLFSAQAPQAAFSFSPASPLVGQTVTFTDASSGAATSWSWSFGDGGASTSQSPTHAYALPGPYTVTLVAGNAGGSSTATRIVTVAAAQGPLALTSGAGADGGALPAEYTCDGTGASPAMSWSNVPAGAQQLALLMTTVGADGVTKWNWVLYGIPADAGGLLKNGTGVGILGVASRGIRAYDPPCSQGPGPRTYTFTLYALSAAPQLPADPDQVTGAVLAQAISGLTLGSASMTLTYTRSGGTSVAAFTFAPQAPAVGQTVTFTDTSTGAPTAWAWNFGDGGTSTLQSPTHAYAAAGTYDVQLTVTWPGQTASKTQALTVGTACGNGSMNLEQAISDQAQRTTIAFAGLALITGNLEAQTFFPPGKLVDYWGFQYLRDNDADNMGHNTSFLTRASCDMIYILSDAQMAQLKALATGQVAQINQYGYGRYPLMKAFRRLVDGDVPEGSTGLDLQAVRAASRSLYELDGQLSFDRAVAYAAIFRSWTADQKAYVDAMVGKGWASWPDKTMEDVRDKMAGLSPDESVAVMTYAGDMFSWYAGCVNADVYFCPERHGTYFGSFYIKDAPAIGHEGYSIDETLTATAGSALCDSSKGYVTSAQAALVSSLTDLQRENLYAGASNIVQARSDISAALRGLIGPTAPSAEVLAQIKATVLARSAEYGELDGENNYDYATVFAQLKSTLSAAQLEQLGELRHSILSGTYADGTPFDFTTCDTYYMFSAPVSDPSDLDPYLSNTDAFFTLPAAPQAAFSFSPESPLAGQGVSFTDASTGTVTSWSWSFGDGGTSALQNPTHAYAAAGTYTVTLVAGNAGGTSTATHSVTVKPAAPTSAFGFTPAAPVVGQTVTFSDASTGTVTAWSWSFGDGGTSALQNPTHAYAAAGTYTVTLVAGNAGGTSTASKVVTVGTACVITSIRKAQDPFRLKIYGSGFQPGCRVIVDGWDVPLSIYKGAGQVNATGTGLRDHLPDGQPVAVVVVNPDGGRSMPYNFAR